MHSGGAVAKHWRHPPPPVIAHSYVDARAGVCLHEYHSRWGAVGHSMQRGAWGGQFFPLGPATTPSGFDGTGVEAENAAVS